MVVKILNGFKQLAWISRTKIYSPIVLFVGEKMSILSALVHLQNCFSKTVIAANTFIINKMEKLIKKSSVNLFCLPELLVRMYFQPLLLAFSH